jgi:hypothetical protein
MKNILAFLLLQWQTFFVNAVVVINFGITKERTIEECEKE